MAPLNSEEVILVETGVEIGSDGVVADLEALNETVLSDSSYHSSPNKSPPQQQNRSRPQEPDGAHYPNYTNRNSKRDPDGVLMREGDMLDHVFEKFESVVCRGQEDPSSKVVDQNKKGGSSTSSQPPQIASVNSIIEADQPPAPLLGSAESAEEKRQEHQDRAVIPETAATSPSIRGVLKNPNLVEIDCEEKHDDEAALLRELVLSPTARTGNLSGKPVDKKQTPRARGDLLDYIFHNVESIMCREKNPAEAASQEGDAASDGSSPIKLHKLAEPQPADTLDLVCNNVEGYACRDPNQKKRSAPVLPHDESSITQGSSIRSSVDIRDARVRICRSQSLYRSQSLLDQALSSDLAASSSEETESSARIDSIRKKKREIETQVQSSSSEPGFLVPIGYRSIAIPSSKQAEVVAQQEEKSKFTRNIVVGLVAILISAAASLVAISFFWPMLVGR